MLLLVTGASGVGKSSTLDALTGAFQGWRVMCVELNSIGVPPGRQDPVSVFGFIAAKKAEHSVKTMCRVLEVCDRDQYVIKRIAAATPFAFAEVSVRGIAG